MERIEFFSYGKLNLFLEITGKRRDGYHEIFSLFQTISIADKIIIEKKKGELEIEFSDNTIKINEDNTVVKAVKKLRVKKGLKIFIEKNIPAGSGVGGGSSNAAAILLMLNRFLNLGFSFSELWKMAMEIGSDVPFFLFGGSAIVMGRGEIIIPVSPPPYKYFLLKIPKINVSTRLVYENLTEYGDKSKIYAHFLEGKFNKFFNRLEKVAFKLYPELGEVKKRMLNLSDFVLMSGSGASFFAGFRSEKDIPDKEDLILCKRIDREDYLFNFGASPSGKASGFGPDIRGFESSRPSTNKTDEV